MNGYPLLIQVELSLMTILQPWEGWKNIVSLLPGLTKGSDKPLSQGVCMVATNGPHAWYVAVVQVDASMNEVVSRLLDALLSNYFSVNIMPKLIKMSVEYSKLRIDY